MIEPVPTRENENIYFWFVFVQKCLCLLISDVSDITVGFAQNKSESSVIVFRAVPC